MRIYDPRLGRFLSNDPIAAKYPFYSPYQFAGNMPIWATDLDGLEPNLVHQGDGIYGVGLFDEGLGSIERHQTVIRIGTKDKQFQIQWLLSNNGETIGYLASRVVPEEEYKRLYGGRGEGLQPAFVIAMDKFTEFGKHANKYYDMSRNAELNEIMYGEIERDPVKSLFDPRTWLLGRVAGATGKLSGQFFGSILSKAGAMSNAEARIWYNLRLSKINTNVAATEANARVLHAERNNIKFAARLLMKDQRAASALDKTDPIRSFEFYVEKYKEQGYKGTSLWKKIIEGAPKANPDVNAKFNIK